MKYRSIGSFFSLVARVFSLLSLMVMVLPSYSQNFSFTKPIRLPKTVNSVAEESKPLLNEKGDSLFFVRSLHQDNNGGKTAGQDIWISIKQNGQWSEATNNYPSLNNYRNNAVVGIDTSGTKLYLLDSYSPASTKVDGIASTKFTNKIYSEPSTIKIKGIEARNSFIDFYVKPTADVLLVSMEGPNSLGEEDLYVVVKDEFGDWSTPINLGPTINTRGFEISPFLSWDGMTLFFASSGHEGYGDADIFMSRRLYNNSWVLWSRPINLGEEINSSGFDAYPFMTYDKQNIFFVSNRNSVNTDIYMSEVIEVLQEELRAEINPSKYKLTETEIQALLGLPVSRQIYFDFAAFEIKQSSRELLNFLIEKLKENRQYHVELIGHTDDEGTDAFNLELSRRRANEIENYFINAGITPGRISSKGVGEARLLVKEGTPEEKAKNRRVEIIFTKDSGQ